MSRPAVANAYLGTSEFAAEVLRALAESPHRPRLVLTPPDRRKGRGRKAGPPPVAALAEELGLPLHQTKSVNEPGSVEALKESGARVGVVCAFGQLIAEPLLSELPMLNIHPSLLPRWRGAAPIERAIMTGDERTGVCVMRLTEGLDSGPVALRAECEIGERNYGELAADLSALSGELILRALDAEAEGRLQLTEQSTDGVTYAEKIEAGDRRLDPARPAVELARVVRALTPHIGAHLLLDEDTSLGVRAARAIDGSLGPGEVRAEDQALLLGCSEGTLSVERVQPSGKREMAADDWLRGHEPPPRVPVG
ncbi:MAG TPA: methionyl-tRNA formyltransferase [Solirubrobacterales bacterium]|nr:methionyl-tRNA formyltransferase [Solirubrobacterales bacterium]